MKPLNFISLCGCLFLIGSAEVISGPMMGQMALHFGVDSSTIAFLPAAYGLVYAAAAIGLGPFSDRWGRKRLLQAGLLGFAICNALIPLAPSIVAAVVLSALSGLGAAIVQPNALSLVFDEALPGDATRLVGRIFIGLMLAFVLTPALAGALANTVGWGVAYFALAVLTAGICLIVSLAFIARLPLVERETTFTAAHRRALNVPGVLRQLSASYLWLGWVAGFGAVVAEVAAKKLQMTPAELGLLSGLFGAAVILGNLMSGCLRRALGEAALPLLALVSAAGLFAFMLPVRSGIQLALLGLPWAFGYGGAGPLHHARLSLLSEPSRGTINSYHASLLNLGIFSVSVLLGTSVRDASHSIFCAATGAIALCGACLLLPFSLRETDK